MKRDPIIPRRLAAGNLYSKSYHWSGIAVGGRIISDTDSSKQKIKKINKYATT